MVISGETLDIIQFCWFGFYDWLMSRDEPIQYTDENYVFGRYLGPEIDVGI